MAWVNETERNNSHNPVTISGLHGGGGHPEECEVQMGAPVVEGEGVPVLGPESENEDPALVDMGCSAPRF